MKLFDPNDYNLSSIVFISSPNDVDILERHHITRIYHQGKQSSAAERWCHVTV